MAEFDFDPTAVQVFRPDRIPRLRMQTAGAVQLDGTGIVPKDIKEHSLPAGTYYLAVRPSLAASAQSGQAGRFNYRLQVTVRSP